MIAESLDITYALRWGIVVFFKECEQLMCLGKHQSTDFDVQTASTELTMIQYFLISIKHRFDNYEPNGALFTIQGSSIQESCVYSNSVKIAMDYRNTKP